MDVEAPLNAGVPLSNEVPFDYKLNGTNFEGQVPESALIISHFVIVTSIGYFMLCSFLRLFAGNKALSSGDQARRLS